MTCFIFCNKSILYNHADDSSVSHTSEEKKELLAFLECDLIYFHSLKQTG